jgi:homoserine O-acetyltransferase/O-succinyltransferase
MPVWTQHAVSQTFDAPGFMFDSGQRTDLRLHCRMLGEIAPQGDNAVLMLHGTVGSGKQFLQPSTADALFSPGQPLDVSKFCILLPDAIGHGLSSKPSDGLGTTFPRYGYGDMVRAQHLLVVEHFGLKRLRLVLGTSMGGMHTWMWGQNYPELMDALMPIASLPERVTGRNLLMRRIMLSMLQPDRGGFGPAGLGPAWNLFKLLVDSPARLAEQFEDTASADRHVRDVAAAVMEAEDVNDVIWEFEASRDYDPEPGLGRIAVPLLAVNFADDDINPPALGVLARAIMKIPRGRAVTLPAGPESRGHQTLQVARLWAHCVAELLEASSQEGATES